MAHPPPSNERSRGPCGVGDPDYRVARRVISSFNRQPLHG